MTREPRPRYALVLEALPDPGGVPVEQRLRRALKYLKNACGLRCVSAAEQAPPTGGEPDDDRREA